MAMINWVLPGFYLFAGVNTLLIQAMDVYPERFKKGQQIAAIYDCFPGVKWNGGRTVPGLPSMQVVRTSAERIRRYTDIPMRLTYTNCCLDQQDLYDEYANEVTDYMAGMNAEILINDMKLRNHIDEVWPNTFPYILSTTLWYDIHKLKGYINSGEWKLVVTDYRDNLLMLREDEMGEEDRFTDEEKPFVEILVNETCNPQCEYRKAHYEQISREAKKHNMSINQCHYGITGSPFLYAIEHYDTCLTSEQVIQLSIKGYSWFKIAGRGMSELDLIEAYVHYLVNDDVNDKNFIRYLLTRQSLGEICQNEGVIV